MDGKRRRRPDAEFQGTGDGRNGTLADFSEGDGRNGTLADLFGGCWEERNALRFLRSDEWLLGRVVAVMLLRVIE